MVAHDIPTPEEEVNEPVDATAENPYMRPVDGADVKSGANKPKTETKAAKK